MTDSGTQSQQGGFEGDTDWFTPVAPPRTVATLDRPEDRWHSETPDYADSLQVVPQDIYAALGPQADELMASVDVDVDELIRLINAETTLLPPILDVPDDLSGDRTMGKAQTEEASSGLLSAVKKWKRTFLKGTIAAVLLTLTGGGAAAIAMNKSVTVDVDGVEHSVRTYAGTVGEVLEDEGITTGAHDSLSPSPTASVGDGGKIVVQRGKLLKYNVDGQAKESWVRARTLGDGLRQAGAPMDNAKVSDDLNKSLPLDGMSVDIRTLKNVTVFDGGNAGRQVQTTAISVDELMRELQTSLGPQDAVTPGADVKITDGAEVRISRSGVTVVNKTETVPPPVEEIKDPEMAKGTQQVMEAGAAGEKMVTWRVTLKDGKETGKEKLGEKITKEPVKKVVKVGTKAPAQPVISDGAVWDRLAQCEATGNWAINTGNGYYGGLQFDASTWRSNGGTQYAALPHQASREQQIAIATKVRDARGGYSAWPACAKKLGLPR
ncbi:MAG: transglycosylase family protein [Kibdelosporangium sp.]